MPGGGAARERADGRITTLLDAARAGTSGALLVRGEPGIGKTHLLAEAIGRAGDLRVLRACGVESELELPFSALDELLRPVVPLLGGLPAPQAHALAQALAIEPAEGGYDRFTVCAATLSLLAAAAGETGVLVVVDDVQWLDAASGEALAFAARRLDAEGVALVAAARTGVPTPLDATGLEELHLAPLDAGACRALARARFSDVADDVAGAAAEASAGNPLALFEMLRALPAEARSGLAPIELPMHAPSLEAVFAATFAEQPPGIRTCLVVAAANDLDDAATALGALEVLGTDRSVAEAAESAGLLVLEAGRIRFIHPLARSAAYHGAGPADRRAAHRALAETLGGDPESSDRRAWHLGAGAVGPDETAAGLLEETASRAARRNGHAAAERALARAAALSTTAADRARRLHGAAQMAYHAGRLSAAAALADAALAEAPDGAMQPRGALLRARIATHGGSASDAQEVLVREAERVAPEDAVTAATLLAEAVVPALRAGVPRAAVAIGRQARALAGPDGPAPVAGLVDLMLGTGLLLTGEGAEGSALVRGAAAADEALDLFADEPQLRTYLGFALHLTGDDRGARRILTGVVNRARGRSSPGVLPYALARLGRLELEAGHWSSAEAMLSDAVDLARATGQAGDGGIALGALAWLDAARGREETSRARAREALSLAGELGAGSGLDYAGAAIGLLELGLGRAEVAVAHLEPAIASGAGDGWSDAAASPHRVPDLIEALVRAGRSRPAAAALASFRDDAERSCRPSAMAAALRCAGLVAADEAIDAPFAHAIAVPGQPPFELARTRLCYGERLRRVRRRTEGRTHVRAALDVFDLLGAAPWAERAGDELRASGETVRRRDPGAVDELTPAERRIVALVARGATNKEVAAQLFVTPKTVEFHLGRVFRKLGLRTRGELAHVLRETAGELFA